MADSSLNGLASATSANASDLIYLLRSPFSSGYDRKITFTAFEASLNPANMVGGSSIILGPASASDSHIVAYDGTTGKLVKDGGVLGTAAHSAVGDFLANSAGTVANSNLANMAATTFKMRKTASSGPPEDATATEATAALNALVGDSGSGGTKGLAPAPGAGDAAANKYLKADGTWDVPTGTGAGDVVGPAGATTLHIAQFNGATGKLLQDGGVLGTAAHSATSDFDAAGTTSTHAALTATHGVAGDIVGTTDTQTLTNKRVTKRVLALSANSATPSINTDSYDVVHITSQTAAITSFTTNLTGTPVDGDTLRISITGTGAVGLTWGSKFEASTVALPSTTVSTDRLDVGFIWNTETTKWRCIGAV